MKQIYGELPHNEEVYEALDSYERILKFSNPNLKPERFVEVVLLDEQLRDKIKRGNWGYLFEDVYSFFKIFNPVKISSPKAKTKVLKRVGVVDIEIFDKDEFSKAKARVKIGRDLSEEKVLETLWKLVKDKAENKNKDYYFLHSPGEETIYALLYHDRASVKPLIDELRGKTHLQKEEVPVEYVSAFCEL